MEIQNKYMKVKLVSITNGFGEEFQNKTIEEMIVYVARASSSRSDKFNNIEGLINYCINNKHWSIFEHGFLTFEIITSKAIAIQLLRHRSNYFQEFSQRYQDVNKLNEGEGIFEPIELRQQAVNNRQSSTEVFDPIIKVPFMENMEHNASNVIRDFLQMSQELYSNLLDAGVAREMARMVLPMATKTRLYVTMNVRSVIHWLDLRDDSHAQKEIQLIAKEVKKIFIEECPIISKARGYTD